MCLVEPGAFREMHSFVQKSCEGSGRLEVISLAATGDLACFTLPNNEHSIGAREMREGHAVGRPALHFSVSGSG